jgi:hypothetical protein
MAETDSNARAPGGNPEDIVAQLTGQVSAWLRVASDQELGLIEIHVALLLASGGFGRLTVLVGHEAALDLALRLIGAGARARKLIGGAA